MFRIKQIMSIANAERRLNRRLVRYWVFVSLAYLITFFLYAQLTVIHGLFSSYSSTVGAISPRFLLGMLGLFYAAVFLIGTIFLAFDIRARDKREQMLEVLDSRPFTNLELVCGRYLGIFLSSWIPMVVLIVILQLLGFILQSAGVPAGEPIEIYSLFSFIFIMAIPALSFTIALVFFVTLLVRNRLVAAVILLAFIGGTYAAMVFLPAAYASLFDIIGIGSTFFCSEIVPQLATPEGWIQRLSVLLAAFGLLGLSAAVHPRLDGRSRSGLTVISTVIMVVGLSLTGYLVYDYSDIIGTQERWKEAHAAVANEVVPDLKKITGEVKIIPGKELVLDLDIAFSAPDGNTLKTAFFTLNPGQTVTSVKDAAGKEITFTHENGLLELTLPQALKPGQETTLHLNVQGLPDDNFAFLETPYDLLLLNSRETGDIGLFGASPGVFDKSFVTLIPGQRWLPMSGPEKGRDDPRIRPVDFFEIDLKVDVPEGWLVAGPGRRHKVESGNDSAGFRFSPPAAVPEVALVASRFESRAMEVEGITLEMLVSKKHMKNVEVLAEAKEKIREWIDIHLKGAKEYGLPYPYDALTLVEIPNYIRTYGGGWRMDTVMAPPGMLLMREISFPTARFDSAFRKPETFKDKEGGIQQAKLERVKTFFTNDFSGGNIFSGASRNFFINQTSATGPEGLALNYVMETLSNLLITETDSFFSAHDFFKSDSIDPFINRTIGAYSRDPSGKDSIVDQAMGNVVNKPEVWETALEVSLEDIDPWENPAVTVDILIMKANAIAKIILDTMGPEKTGQLLASIRETNKGKSYSLADVVNAGKALGHDLGEILGDWLGSTDLPGFVCEEGKIYRIEDSEDGNPRYQLLLKIRNDEPAPGFFCVIQYYAREGAPLENIKSDPIRLPGKSAVQYGAVLSSLPAAVYLDPYLSLNRDAIFLNNDRSGVDKVEKVDPIEGIKELTYSVPEKSILVDDLDPGFSIVKEEKDNGMRLIGRDKKKENLDQGLPVTSNYRVPGVWSRVIYTSSYGKYRQTFAVVEKGDGDKKAVIEADINKDGQWDLEIHLPWKPNIMPRKKWGTYHLVITDMNGDKHDMEFDSKAAEFTWNLVGSIYLPKGKTTVTVSNETDGDFVVVDAIRWTPSAGN